jgi:hypothetical protein
MSYERGKLFLSDVLAFTLAAIHPYTFVRLFSFFNAVISGYTFPSGTPIIGDPPYPQSELGKGGDSSGASSTRRAGAEELGSLPVQSAL